MVQSMISVWGRITGGFIDVVHCWDIPFRSLLVAVKASMNEIMSYRCICKRIIVKVVQLKRCLENF